MRRCILHSGTHPEPRCIAAPPGAPDWSEAWRPVQDPGCARAHGKESPTRSVPSEPEARKGIPQIPCNPTLPWRPRMRARDRRRLDRGSQVLEMPAAIHHSHTPCPGPGSPWTHARTAIRQSLPGVSNPMDCRRPRWRWRHPRIWKSPCNNGRRFPGRPACPRRRSYKPRRLRHRKSWVAGASPAGGNAGMIECELLWLRRPGKADEVA